MTEQTPTPSTATAELPTTGQTERVCVRSWRCRHGWHAWPLFSGGRHPVCKRCGRRRP